MLNSEMANSFLERESNFFRDQIVVLGRPQAGKTVYLSLLYEMLWSTNGNLKMKSVKGAHHANMIKTAAEIKAAIESGKSDKWTPATVELSPTYLDVKYHDQTKTMVTLDYSGEVFQDAFIRDVDSEPVRQLLEHIDHAEAIILLVDPEHIVGGNVDAAIDNNFGMLQAITRIQNWPGGKDVPVVLVLTKVDKTQRILKEHGGTKAFVKKYFSDLVSTTRHLKVCKVSARSVNGASQAIYTCTDLKTPVLYCLDVIQKREEVVEELRRRKKLAEHSEKLAKKERFSNVLLHVGLLILLAIVVLIVVLILPSTVWFNLKYNIFKLLGI